MHWAVANCNGRHTDTALSVTGAHLATHLAALHGNGRHKNAIGCFVLHRAPQGCVGRCVLQYVLQGKHLFQVMTARKHKMRRIRHQTLQ